MNKEEIRKMFSTLTEQWGNTDNYINDLLCYSKSLQQENKQLKEDIKKYQSELEKADSITQSCIFQGKDTSEISFRNCLNKTTAYKTRIDKAIEYIKKAMENTRGCGLEPLDEIYAENIIEILKGENND